MTKELNPREITMYDEVILALLAEREREREKDRYDRT